MNRLSIKKTWLVVCLALYCLATAAQTSSCLPSGKAQLRKIDNSIEDLKADATKFDAFVKRMVADSRYTSVLKGIVQKLPADAGNDNKKLRAAFADEDWNTIKNIVCQFLAEDEMLQDTKITELTFVKSPMISNDRSRDYAIPHWTLRATAPAVLVRDTEIELTVKFSYKKAPAGVSIKIRAANADGYSLAATAAVNDTKAETLTLTNVKLSKKLPNTVAYLEHFKLVWEASADDGATWVEVGTTDSKLYITYATPIASHARTPAWQKLYESVLYLGCKNANGRSTEADIIMAVWNEFVDRDVRNLSGKKLEYYGDPATQVYETGGLLDQNKGQCGSFASLFLDIFYALGIDTRSGGHNYIQFWYINSTTATLWNYGFLVKNWKFTGTGTSGNTTFPYVNISAPAGVRRPDKSYAWISEEVSDQPGVPGQSNSNPSSDFANHQVAFVNGEYYDPSYGIKYATLTDISVKAIDAFYNMERKNVDESSISTDLNSDGDKNDVVLCVFHYIMKNPGGLQLRQDSFNY